MDTDIKTVQALVDALQHSSDANEYHPDHPTARECDAALDAGRALIAQMQRDECLHDETERLGVIWTRCTQCGKKWADDDTNSPFSMQREPVQKDQHGEA